MTPLVCGTRGETIRTTVHNTKVKPSPLVQDGLEIPVRVKVVWPLVEKFSIYITKVEEIKDPITGEYVDDSKEILKELAGPEAVESLDDHDVDEQLGDTEEENCQDNKIIKYLCYDISFLVDLV